MRAISLFFVLGNAEQPRVVGMVLPAALALVLATVPPQTWTGLTGLAVVGGGGLPGRGGTGKSRRAMPARLEVLLRRCAWA